MQIQHEMNTSNLAVLYMFVYMLQYKMFWISPVNVSHMIFRYHFGKIWKDFKFLFDMTLHLSLEKMNVQVWCRNRFREVEWWSFCQAHELCPTGNMYHQWDNNAVPGGIMIYHWTFKSNLQYTLLTLKYGVNLLNAPVSSVLHQNLCAILIVTGSV